LAVLSLRQIAHALNGDVHNDHVRAPGPGHSGTDRSLSIKLTDDGADVIVNTFSSADDRLACLQYVRDKCGIQPKPKANGGDKFSLDVMVRAAQSAAAPSRPKGKIVDSYHYTDERGALLYEVLRYEPKGFRQRRPDGKGGHVWNLDGVRRVPYRWPELIEHPSATVYLCEGEKDTNRLIESGLVATSVQGGKWTDECVQALAGRQVLILEDNDEAGRAKAHDAAQLLHGVAENVKIVRLPGLPERGDVSDWLDAGHTVDELTAFCNAAPYWEPSATGTAVAVVDNDANATHGTGTEISVNAISAALVSAKPAKSEDSGPAITLSYFSDLVEAKPKPWLIKNVIARGECSSWIAPPGKGKSALLTDIFVHGAHGVDWRGYRTRERFGGLYFALERVDLVKRRMTAHRLRDDLPADLPIAIIGQVIDLMARKCVNNIVDAIKRAEDRFSVGVGLICFDTWAKAIAAGGGDESGAKDQNTALANLRRVLDRVPHIHIATIGHTGKDEGRGERGSNAKLADVDLLVQLKGDTIRSANTVKANDQPEGAMTSFRLEPFDFAPDEDGDPFQTFIVSNADMPNAVDHSGKLSNRQQLALEALAEAILSYGIDAPASTRFPTGVKVVTLDQWRDELYRRGVVDKDAANPRSRINELRDALIVKRVIGYLDGLAWLAKGK
jgi:hypothetical protein